MLYYEWDKFGNNEDVTIEEWPDLDYPYLHFHRNYEFICLYGGQLKINLDGEDVLLNPGQFLLIYPNQVHSVCSQGNALARVCIFPPALVTSFYQVTENLVPQHVLLDYPPEVAAFINANLRPNTGKFMLKACLYAICAVTAQQAELQPAKGQKNAQLMHQLLSYISQNYTSDISLHTAAQELGYSYQYLSNQLQKYNLNFSLLLNQHRMDYAKHLLLHSELSISDIALQCGYNNARTFNRNFQNVFHLSPREFRQTKKEPEAC